jgi:Spy/CpxP family protein refolding chaperone
MGEEFRLRQESLAVLTAEQRAQIEQKRNERQQKRNERRSRRGEGRGTSEMF